MVVCEFKVNRFIVSRFILTSFWIGEFAEPFCLLNQVGRQGEVSSDVGVFLFGFTHTVADDVAVGQYGMLDFIDKVVGFNGKLVTIVIDRCVLVTQDDRFEAGDGQVETEGVIVVAVWIGCHGAGFVSSDEAWDFSSQAVLVAVGEEDEVGNSLTAFMLRWDR